MAEYPLLRPGALHGANVGDVATVQADGSLGTSPPAGGAWGQTSTSKYSGSGSPVGVVTPDAEGDLYVDDTTPALWQATGVANTDWQQVGGGTSPQISRASFADLTGVVVSATSFTQLPFVLKGSGHQDDIVNLTDPLNPAVRAAGLYTVTINYQLTSGSIVGKRCFMELDLDANGDDAVASSYFSTDAGGLGNAQGSLALAYFIPAGGVIQAAVEPDTGAGGTYSIEASIAFLPAAGHA